MNREEYYNGNNRNKYHRYVHRLLETWKVKNNITERCVVHHIDDEPAAIEYNNTHYEMFGCEIDKNGDLKFELGKYVQFMTHAEHMSHHHTGKIFSEETKKKISIAKVGKPLSQEAKNKLRAINTGKTLSEETKKKISIANTGVNNGFYGKTHSNEVKAKISAKISAQQKGYSLLWNVYKNNDGTKSYNEFKHAIKTGDITFEMQPISVFINQ